MVNDSAPRPDGHRATPVLHPMDFGNTQPSRDARNVAERVVASNDAGSLPFLIVDKAAARVLAFDSRGRFVGDSAALLGSARGDDSAAGIGDRPLAKILPHERTTPAGRFSAELGENNHGEDILWVDYDSAISMHRVRSVKASENRLQRLASVTATDNRISYGCINVPAAFYDDVVKPLFAPRDGMVSSCRNPTGGDPFQRAAGVRIHALRRRGEPRARRLPRFRSVLIWRRGDFPAVALTLLLRTRSGSGDQAILDQPHCRWALQAAVVLAPHCAACPVECLRRELRPVVDDDRPRHAARDRGLSECPTHRPVRLKPGSREHTRDSTARFPVRKRNLRPSGLRSATKSML